MEDVTRLSNSLLRKYLIKDDNDSSSVGDVNTQRMVDYLTYKWRNELEVLNSWKFVILFKKCRGRTWRIDLEEGNAMESIVNPINNKISSNNNNLARLENLSWRIYAKLLLKKKKGPYDAGATASSSLTQSPLKISNSDVSLLYGPVVDTGNERVSLLFDTGVNSKRLNIKPILKKRSIGEIIEGNAQWKLDITKKQLGENIVDSLQVPTATTNNRSPLLSTPMSSETCSISSYSTTSLSNAIASISQNETFLDDEGNTTIRHIRFNSTVDQCMAIQYLSLIHI